ncbi:NUDIX domain-containing protein [Bacillus sp. 491mf]|uniref:NUDIX hydrolase n=1 Tax=Bacillus sp. 491mf TaxID=1761755 RepID=UPI0008EDFBA6|nr:NUDIX domain-containing protein [Bacillus sp. 491mf]SFC75296.1 NUDIX domain-containing protein [Bacillus sp. 491mf]
MTTIYANYGLETVKLTWKEVNELPPRELITSVHGFCFYNNEVLLVNLNERGWDFPGGHIELDETPESCFQREVMEEGYVEGICTFLGYIIVDHSENMSWNEKSPYPKIGYQPFYCMDITTVHDFAGKYESMNRIFIEPSKVNHYYSKWNALYEEIFHCALNLNGK